jgi:photosystem II stability/assembly factor-like uncharacterized protein
MKCPLGLGGSRPVRTICFLAAFGVLWPLAFPPVLTASSSPDQWRSAGPFGASVEAIAFSGPNDVLAITSNGFLYRSRDNGGQWSLVRFPAQHQGLAHALTVDPHRAGSFLVGISSSNGSLAGLYRTQDDGATWQHVVRDVAVFSAAFSPSDPKVIAAGTKTGILLSRDGGDTWSRISPAENKELQPVMSLGFDPKNAAVLYAGTPHLPWKTSDGGQTWNSIHHGMIDDSDILALIVNQQKPEQLFIGACSGIYRSDNSAGRWNKLLGITGAGFRTYSVALDPAKPETVYSGTRDGLWKSGDLGKTWRKIVPNIVKSVAVSPRSSQTVFLATEDAGVLRSEDGGETFASASRGLADRRMIRMTATGREVLVTLGNDQSTMQGSALASAEPVWKRMKLPAPGTQQFLQHSSTLYAFGGPAAFRSADRGATWKPLPVLPASHAGFGVSASVPLAATVKAVFRLSPNGLAWQPVTALGASAGPIRRLWTTRSGVGPAWVEAGASVWMSADAGKTWGLAEFPVRATDIYELEATSAVVWAATARGLYRSMDAGKTWKLCDKGIDGGSTTPAVAAHPGNPLEAFASQFGKIYRTRDGGDSWSEVPVEGLHGASIASLAVSVEASAGTTQHLVALTSARGVFVHDLRALESVSAAPAASGNAQPQQ